MKYPEVFERLVESLKRLPGVGTKSAERMAYQIIDMDLETIQEFSASLLDCKTKLHHCPICGQITENDVCDVCSDDSRDSSIICVVQTPKDAFALERAKEFKGKYHILHGVISVTNGTGPDDINIASLIKRVKDGGVKEVIIATNPNVEGETTAQYIARLLEKYHVNVTRLAYGLPVGGNLDYTDEYTLVKALEGRRKI
ncbi:MAG: recombination mediator RecR [Bacilli bacterium]|jgi:recombination protein RecR|nr:recombination mediator RecR [Bacilli bacterium]MDD3421930.1 recombination mediator RecR [Bacilli bacterium]MDD4066278.1 recombination mediator RecR [Bacilli bacterium]